MIYKLTMMHDIIHEIRDLEMMKLYKNLFLNVLKIENVSWQE